METGGSHAYSDVMKKVSENSNFDRGLEATLKESFEF
jgi:hypothetical protein